MSLELLILIVRPFRAREVAAKLQELGINDFFAQEVKGYSRQKGYLEKYIGSEYSQAFLPKVEFWITVETSQVPEIAQMLTITSRTGRIGDGKIFRLPLPIDEELLF